MGIKLICFHITKRIPTQSNIVENENGIAIITGKTRNSNFEATASYFCCQDQKEQPKTKRKQIENDFDVDVRKQRRVHTFALSKPTQVSGNRFRSFGIAMCVFFLSFSDVDSRTYFRVNLLVVSTYLD